MVEITRSEKDLFIDINFDTVLLFDMDGTVVDTDIANNLSYKEAIRSVMRTEDELFDIRNKRINRTCLNSLIPNLTEGEFSDIILYKEGCYTKYLHHTKLNSSVIEVLNRYCQTNKTILVTNCRKERALQTLNFYNLTYKFSSLIFRQTEFNGTRINKYKNAIQTLNLSIDNVVVFENEMAEINDAISVGIAVNKIFKL